MIPALSASASPAMSRPFGTAPPPVFGVRPRSGWGGPGVIGGGGVGVRGGATVAVAVGAAVRLRVGAGAGTVARVVGTGVRATRLAVGEGKSPRGVADLGAAREGEGTSEGGRPRLFSLARLSSSITATTHTEAATIRASQMMMRSTPSFRPDYTRVILRGTAAGPKEPEQGESARVRDPSGRRESNPHSRLGRPGLYH